MSPFYASAAKIANIAASPRTVTPSSSITIDISNTGNSTINGRSLAAGGIVPTASVPDGQSGPLNANSKWIVSKTPTVQTSANLTFAPGNSKLFKFAGQKLDFKGSITAGLSFSVRWSTDNGLTWKQNTAPIVLTQTCWCLIDFGAPLGAGGAVEIIGEDQLFETFGFDFDTGPSAPAAFVDTAPPAGMYFGDSYVFCQGSRNDGLANNQQATLGMTRKAAEAIGCLQIHNDGFRQNGFSQTQAGVQSRFCDRILLPPPADPALSEGTVWGALDYVLINASINDASGAFDSVRLADTTQAFTNLRIQQPNALIVFVFGENPPDLSESTSWHDTSFNAFKAVFGTTSANWIHNGSYLLDGSRATGANWVPAGAVGSSPYFPASGDANVLAHPNPTGHAFFGTQAGNQLVALAQSIVAGG